MSKQIRFFVDEQNEIVHIRWTAMVYPVFTELSKNGKIQGPFMEYAKAQSVQQANAVKNEQARIEEMERYQEMRVQVEGSY